MAKFDKVIPPGQEGSIEFKIDGKQVKGRFSKSATVFTNDPIHKRMTISMSGHITPYVVIEPTARVFLSGSFGEKIEREVTVYSNEKENAAPFKITKVESNIDDKITYKVFQTEEDRKYIIKVWKNPNLPVMNTFGNLFIYTNSENAPKKILQVQVSTKSEMIVKPSIINFGTILDPLKRPKDEPIKRSLTITNRKSEFEIEDITFSVEGFRATVDPVEEGSSYKVTVDFFPEPSGSNYLSEMVIHTNYEREPEVRVRLVARMGRKH